MATSARFRRLLEPMQWKKVKLRNRIVKPAQRLGFVDKSGHVTQQDLDFYEALAKGGVGLIVIDHAFVDPLGAKIRQACIAEEKYIPSMAKLAAVIHKHACPVFLQINHVGQDHDIKASGVAQPLGPSALTQEDMHRLFPFSEKVHNLPRALTIPEIKAIVVKFAEAAARAEKAGFDGVEIHGAHGYLIACFLSRIWNRRDDEYGNQSLENRTRLGVEVLRAVKERVGKDFAVGIRMNGGEYGIDTGTTAAEGQQIAKIFEAAGADYIDVSAFGYGAYSRFVVPEQVFFPEPPKPFSSELDGSKNGAGALIPLAAGVKEVVSVPVIAVGRLDPFLGEWMLRKHMADAIALGRRLLADPELPNKLAAGRYEDIAPCTGCITCMDRSQTGLDVTCRINAALGKEREYEITPAKNKKKVVVVGGGPAGMEAARVAALRGHEVTLYEKAPRLGGLLPLAAFIKGTEVEDLPAITRYLGRQITRHGVKIILGKEFTPALAEKIKADVVILATGGLPFKPDLPGITRRNVMTAEELHRRAKVFINLFGPALLGSLSKLWLPLGKRVVVIGGSIQGCETAAFLVKRGRKVTIVEESSRLGANLLSQHRPKLLAWLAAKGAAALTDVALNEITDRGLVVTMKDGQKKTLEADTIVIALPPKPNDELVNELKGKVTEVYQVGDCKEPRLIVDAIGDASRVCHAI